MHSSSKLKTRAVATFIGILWISAIGVLLQLNYFPGVVSPTPTITVGPMSTSINVVAFCNRQIFELVVFLAKNMFAAVVHPDCYVLVKADMAIEELAGKDVATRKARHRRMSRVGSFVGTDKSLKRVTGKRFKRVQRVVVDKISSGKGESLGRRAVGTVAVVAGAASAAAATVVAVAS